MDYLPGANRARIGIWVFFGLFSGFVGQPMRRAAQTTPEAVWQIEQRGLEAVPDNERQATPTDLAWNWGAANVGIFAATAISVVLVSRGLNIWQVVLAAVLGAAGTYVFVAIVGIAGSRTGTPTMVASRATFGVRGNLIPTAFSWLVLAGTEVVMCTTATAAVSEVVQGFGLPSGLWLTIPVSLLLVAGAAAIAYFGHGTIMVLQKWLGWILGGLALLLCVVALFNTDWPAAMSAPPGSLASLMSGIGWVAASAGVMWFSTGADYSRYLPRSEPKRNIFGATLIGSGVPLVVFVSLGAVIALGNTRAFGGSAAGMGLALPDWLQPAYLVVVIVGMLTAADLAMYSSGLSLQTLGVRLSRPKASLVNSGVVAVVAVIVMVMGYLTGAQGPLAFEAMITVFQLPLVAWVGIFGLDVLLRPSTFDVDVNDVSSGGRVWFHRGFHWPAVGSWLFGIVIGLLWTTVGVGPSTWFSGPLAGTWIGQNSLGWLVGGIAATAAYWVLGPLIDDRRSAA